MVAQQLPDWDTLHSDKQSYRQWKRAIQHAGKRQSFSLLEPHIRRLSSKVRNRQHTAYDKSKSMPPTERRRILLAALDVIAADTELTDATRIANTSADFTLGISGVGSYVIFAGVLLVEAMLASTNFEQKIMGSLTMLHAVDKDIVQAYGLSVVEPQSRAG
jgi:hypothetical protein